LAGTGAEYTEKTGVVVAKTWDFRALIVQFSSAWASRRGRRKAPAVGGRVAP
jgi:hypothetical protein